MLLLGERPHNTYFQVETPLTVQLMLFVEAIAEKPAFGTHI